MGEATKTNYKGTLNLPRTKFAMRARLNEAEPQSQQRWEQMRLYERVIAEREGGEPFAFHDGPPYANELLHVGHLLNKVLKDLVVRSRLMEGKHCRFVPGWDCHGLPIEHRVVTELVESGKLESLERLSDDERRMAIRSECRAYAEKYQKLQAEQMKSMLTLADYDHPYLTMTPDYERGVLEVFASLVEQGLVYRALKSVHWSIENRTALADAELEYHDKEDVSVYVAFEAADRSQMAAAFGVELDQTPSLMIWTTTPWTLPANLAIAVNDRFSYALVKADGDVTVIAEDLVDTVTRARKCDAVQVLGKAVGQALVGLSYRHPFCDRTCPVVSADYVTLADGTGLVHTAPGHGEEDNLTALREGLEIYCPVQEDGTYDDTVPQWLRGMSIWEANGKIVEHLRATGHLFHSHSFVHSYPHDWRSKTPVIFRATEQWFIGVDTPLSLPGRGAGGEGRRDETSQDSPLTPALSPQGERGKQTLRSLALEAAESQIEFFPAWSRNRMRGMLETRPDWCISRQRAWGLPIPAFRTPQGDVLLTAASVRAVARVFGERGSDAWFTEAPEVLLAGYDPAEDPDAPQSLRASSLKSQASSLTKMHDIFDVWLESGSSWHAAMRNRDLGYPVDLYLEGSDQHRGWFQLSLLPGLGMTGQTPFRQVVTHGFTVDKDGRKMSKSLGNTLDVEDLLKDFGADVCRWWVSSLAYENDVRIDESFFTLAGDSYRKVRNTLRFLLSNLSDFAPPGGAPGNGLCADPGKLPPTSMDAYVLAQAALLQERVRAGYEQYAFRKVHQALYDFCNDTLSAFYCAAAKDRLYCDKTDAPRRRATQAVMWDLMQVLCRLLAPILPHTADEAYRALCWGGQCDDGAGDERCVHLQTYVSLPQVQVDEGWPAVLQQREAALKALEAAKERGIENPLDAEVVLPDPDDRLARFVADLADMLGVSRVKLAPGLGVGGGGGGGDVVVNDLRDQPRCDRCWKRTQTTKSRGDGGVLCDRCADAVGTE